MKYSWIIWDFNGTLLDDSDFNMRIMDDMLLERGKPKMQGIEDYRRRFCFPVKEYYIRAGWNFSEYTFEELAEDYVRRYKAGCGDLKLFPDVRAALSAVKKAGLRQAVLSASEILLLRRQLGELDILGEFDEVIGVEDIYASGKVELGKRFIASSGIDPKRAVLIGDTEHDALVAREIGTDCALVPRGHQSAEILAATGFPVFPDIAAAARGLLDIK
ncbi:MAG: HAD family hydrolase [Eubacteriales bacterium]|nr:HAD family hydrolase [Eubacteriales bacterium]MDD3880757.1 HAD family hydrolase [Eubacteriales bacterium]MDD3882896.1 HAD family hydrolase [Eubacteriales bacterium]MDD4511610.1 HAD family hydrolase [Eubacteriales bacterium]